MIIYNSKFVNMSHVYVVLYQIEEKKYDSNINLMIVFSGDGE
jgi:hypothetical protein